MPDGTTDDDLREETVRVLLDACPEVREYLSRAVATRPIERTIADWESERPDDLRKLQGEGGVTPALNLLSGDDLVRYEETPTPLESEFIADLRANVHAELRRVPRRLSLTPSEFATYLLSQAAGWNVVTIADELQRPPEQVRRELERARDAFRTSMRMVDLCERLDDPELEDDLRQWRIFRDPVG